MVFVAGGFHWIHQSSDSQNWYEGGDFGGHLRTVTFGNGLFIAAGDEQVAISHDGTSWTSIHDHGINQINDITFGNNLFVAVGDNGSVLTSADNGISWTHYLDRQYRSRYLSQWHFYIGYGIDLSI